MTYEEWFNSYVTRNGKIIEGLARADAWDAAYIEGQKAMLERAAGLAFDAYTQVSTDHEGHLEYKYSENLHNAIRALPIEGE